jgi:hypothetical protein
MRKQWTREIIIRQLLEREANGQPLTVGGLGVDKSLYGAARRIFGSWRNAIQAAGIEPSRVLTWERWSPARILVMIRHLARRDKPLSTQQMERRYQNLVTAARRHFGSWSKAILSAGVKPTKLQRVIPWNQQRVVEAILTRALRNNSLVARLVEPRSLVEASHRFFGGWVEAVKAAGLDPELTILPPRRRKRPGPASARPSPPGQEAEGRKPWTKERVVASLHARLREQKPMHSAALARDDKSLYHAARRHHRSWSEAMRAAGLDPSEHLVRQTRRSPTASARAGGPVARQSHSREALRPDYPAQER